MRIRFKFLIQGFDNQNLTNFRAEKKLLRSEIALHISLDLHKERLSYRRSLEPSKENIQHFKT
jgi:hypothetical protein